MVQRKKVEDRVLINEYKKLNNVWKVGKVVGLCGQSVHERLCKLNVINKINVFNTEDDFVLILDYTFYRDEGKLYILAERLSRTVPFICRQARRLGLTNPKRKAKWQEIPGTNPYFKYHYRVRADRGRPNECSVCGITDPTIWYDWANLTGNYENIYDYSRMCRICHRAYDKTRPVQHAS